MRSYPGSCLCGKVRFSATQVKTRHHVCHCTMCRRWGGAPGFAAQVGDFELAGTEYVREYESSASARRGFCAECGSNLYYFLVSTKTYYVSVGAFDNADSFELVGELFVEEQPVGYRYAGDLARLTGEEFVAMLNATDTSGE